MSRPIVWGILLSLAVGGCTSGYPYLVTTDDCYCERFTYRNERRGIEIELTGSYEVRERIASTLEITFRNGSGDTLRLTQGFVKATSRNVRYQHNDRFLPLPHVLVPPGGRYTLTIEGADTEAVGNPWLKIAGERIGVEIRGLLLGEVKLEPITFELIPRNPKLSA